MASDAIQIIDAEGRRVGWRRPVALPADIDNPGMAKAKGIVELPLNVYWSSPTRSWNLDDVSERAQVYELVLTEGTDADVRRFISVDELIALWSRLYLPSHVRRAWHDFLREVRGVDVGC